MKFQKDSQTLEDVDVQELVHSHAAELTEEELQQLTVLNEPTDEDNYNAATSSMDTGGYFLEDKVASA